MKNNIELNTNFSTNSYLKLFQVAQMNFSQVLEEEPRIRKKFRRKYAHNTRSSH